MNSYSKSEVKISTLTIISTVNYLRHFTSSSEDSDSVQLQTTNEKKLFSNSFRTWSLITSIVVQIRIKKIEGTFLIPFFTRPGYASKIPSLLFQFLYMLYIYLETRTIDQQFKEILRRSFLHWPFEVKGNHRPTEF